MVVKVTSITPVRLRQAGHSQVPQVVMTRGPPLASQPYHGRGLAQSPKQPGDKSVLYKGLPSRAMPQLLTRSRGDEDVGGGAHTRTWDMKIQCWCSSWDF